MELKLLELPVLEFKNLASFSKRYRSGFKCLKLGPSRLMQNESVVIAVPQIAYLG